MTTSAQASLQRLLFSSTALVALLDPIPSLCTIKEFYLEAMVLIQPNPASQTRGQEERPRQGSSGQHDDDHGGRVNGSSAVCTLEIVRATESPQTVYEKNTDFSRRDRGGQSGRGPLTLGGQFGGAAS